jgi:DNA-binding MarR family transcriptional regulator
MQIPEPALEAARLIDRIERLARSGVPVHGLNPAQWEALRYLARANRFSRTPAGLAAYLGSTRGTVSQTLIALEQKGFVLRQVNGRDRRSVALGLTAQGREVLATDPLLGIARDIAQTLGEEAGAVADMLKRALGATIRRNGGRPFGPCRTCRHFRRDADPSPGGPHFCTLLKEPLSEAAGGDICLEQEDA